MGTGTFISTEYYRVVDADTLVITTQGKIADLNPQDLNDAFDKEYARQPIQGGGILGSIQNFFTGFFS